MSDPTDVVARLAHLDREHAERAVHAALQTLAERISDGEARQLAGRLPPSWSGWLYTTTGSEGFGYDDFLRRLAAREGTDPRTAEDHARAVFWVLGQWAGPDEAADIASELPADFEPLAAEVCHRFAVRADALELVEEVAERAALPESRARQVIEAVLETLAERIAGGEVDDLEAVLPTELHPALERGRQRTGGRPRRLSLDAFIERVAERLGVPPLEARGLVEAVFAALRKTVPNDEWVDVTAQLPTEYAAVGAHPQTT
jgi:uncharacterized protein (DUF2267 family)